MTRRQAREAEAPKNTRAVQVSQSMLDEAQDVLEKIDAELTMLRPHLPVLKDMSESQKEQVFEQVEKLVPLQATVSVLLPAFLAINGNVEPAKRVKIMLFMFRDQLEHMKQGNVILRLTDLEKLKTQMTRCIGFVRLSNNQIAQRLISKGSAYIAAQMQLYSRKSRKGDDAKRTRAGGGDDAKDGDRPGKRVKTPVSTSPPATPQKGASTPASQAEAMSEAFRRVREAAAQRHAQHVELANADPVAFVQLAWNELAAAQSTKQHTLHMQSQWGVDDSLHSADTLFGAFAADAETPEPSGCAHDTPATPEGLQEPLGTAISVPWTKPPAPAAAENEWWGQHIAFPSSAL